MSQPCSRLLYPFDLAPRPSLEPEVKRAILAAWAPARAAPRHDLPPQVSRNFGDDRI